MPHFIYNYAECLYAECRYAECLYAECRYAKCSGAVNRNAAGMAISRISSHFQKKFSNAPQIEGFI